MNKYLWTLPFLSFFSGYVIISFAIKSQSVKTPLLVGQDLAAATKVSAALNLNIRILNQKEDDDLPNNTIIQQMPRAGQVIKENQSIFCVISKKAEELIAPDLFEKAEQEINEIAKNKKIKIIMHYVPSSEKNNICIGQLPKSGQLLNQKPVIAYITHCSNQFAIVPSFYHKSVNDIKMYLESYGFKVQPVHLKTTNQPHICDNCIIIDQKPLPGTIIDLKKPGLLQLIC